MTFVMVQELTDGTYADLAFLVGYRMVRTIARDPIRLAWVRDSSTGQGPAWSESKSAR
jgi:hypothetical protein